MMKKRLSKIIWYGTDVDSEGNPIIPPFTTDPSDLDGLHVGELFLHFANEQATLWSSDNTGNIVQIGGAFGDEIYKIFLRKDEDDRSTGTIASDEINKELCKLTTHFFGEIMNMKKTLNRPTPNLDTSILRRTMQYQCLIGNVRGNIIRR